MTRESVSGSITRVGNNQKSFLMEETGDKWFGAFAQDQLQGAALGDKVSFFYESVEKGDRTFHNIKGNVTVVNKTPPPAKGVALGPPLSREWLILRQNALTNAVAFVSQAPGEGSVADVLETASQFAEWTSGSADEEKEGDSSEDEDPSTEDWQEAARKLNAA